MANLWVNIAYQREGFQLTADFEIAPGLTVLFGPSGCGKSTLLHLIAGLLQPSRGQMILGEQALYDAKRKLSLPTQHRKVGYVFQQVLLFPHLTVRQNILFALAKLSKIAQQQRFQELSQFLQLADLAERYPQQLSGGQAQRVALARALAYAPQVLLLDEPLNALDSKVREQLGIAIKELIDTLQIPAILVTHQREEALHLADTVLLMESGQIQKIGEPNLLLGRP